MAADYVNKVCNAFALGKPGSDGKLVCVDGRSIRTYTEFEGGLLLARYNGEAVEVEQDDKRFTKTVQKQLKSICEVLSGLGKKVVRVQLGELEKGIRMAEHFAMENSKKGSLKKGHR